MNLSKEDFILKPIVFTSRLLQKSDLTLTLVVQSISLKILTISFQVLSFNFQISTKTVF